jgi:hypothetical protein
MSCLKPFGKVFVRVSVETQIHADDVTGRGQIEWHEAPDCVGDLDFSQLMATPGRERSKRES